MEGVHNRELVFNVEGKEYVGLDLYRSRGGYEALKKVLAQDPRETIGVLKESGLKGRGGASFPTGLKIETVRDNREKERYIICNADEGEPGTFKDRYIMTHLSFQLLEGITIAAFLAGARHGIIYARHEYHEPQSVMRAAIAQAVAAGLLGDNILGSGFSLHLELFSGAGSYLCGEETALLSSIEGRKGRPQLKPPYPTQSGLWGRPTLINNVETLANIPRIIAKGAGWYRQLGTEDSPGTKLISLSGDVEFRGLVEVPFGTTFRDIVYRYAGGPKPGRKVKAVNIGGASGVLIPEEMLDVPLEYGACSRSGITIGSGAVFVLDDTRSILDNVNNRVDFFLHESCGKCTPCREGLRQVQVIIKKLLNREATVKDVQNLERYTRVMQSASFCGLGQAAGNSVISSLHYYRDEYLNRCVDRKNVVYGEASA
ncbi:MAG: NADH-ubiquinone oxidoreductase-F iron-sulfur binding region domain-containing protein [Peptococcaceae bacterium]|nr:NADH-ubiquinone oxidoreductase-F iron-sulfur binding region domain-containing protein [Peptococcaceae bacterium]